MSIRNRNKFADWDESSLCRTNPCNILGLTSCYESAEENIIEDLSSLSEEEYDQLVRTAIAHYHLERCKDPKEDISKDVEEILSKGKKEQVEVLR